MDRCATDHSDSDSGDSWTLIENSSTYADDALEVPDHPTESTTADHHDRDEDTDGISIITDSEPESSSPCEINYEHYLIEENLAPEHHISQFMTVNSDLHDIKNHSESKKDDDDFLGDRGEKHKTYVHRRNKRLSTVLNIIMLGSVITAAGVAIGHMWGAKTDCSMQTSPNVNKILSNLYKLQEENAYLWNKIKELTALNNFQMNQQKTTLKQNKCKKIFEEPLINNDSKKVTKCVDGKFINDDKLLNKDMDKGTHENKFALNKKNKNTYQENKMWLDDEILQPANQNSFKKFNPQHISKSLKHYPKNENKDNYSNEIIDVNENGQNGKKKSEEYLNETKDLNNAADALNYNVNVKTFNNKKSEVFKPGYRYLNDNNKLLKRPYVTEKDFSSNNVDKHVNENNKEQIQKYKKFQGEYGYEYDFSNKGKNTKNNFNNLNEEYNLFNDFKQERQQNIKKRESNRTFKVEMKDINLNKISEDKFGTEEEFLRSIKNKEQKKKDLKSKNKVLKKKCRDCDKEKKTEEKESVRNFKDKTQKIVGKDESNKAFKPEYTILKKNNTPRDEKDTEDEILRNVKDNNIKKDHKIEDNKTVHKENKGNTKYEIPNGKYDTAEQDMEDKKRNDNQSEGQTCEINTKSLYTENPQSELYTKKESLTSTNNKNIKENIEKDFAKSKDFNWNETPKNENDSKKKMQTKRNDFIYDKKTNEEDYYRKDISDEDLKKDNRYIGQKQKEERKKYDRQQSHKKVKRRNKYEQWEMKGGLFKDYDDISMSSSQENVYLLNEPNLKGDRTRTRQQLGDHSIINNNANAVDNQNHDFKDKDEDDQVNWLDKRAKFRTDARQRLEQESLVKNGVNAAGWYFRRMRKREQSRGKNDNSTYRKLLKRKL
ncbi:myb-like protein D [Vanessa tameamea]|uniref:Myb-like protein D n=1 Tax=Vanessa tameamea TaxID=334116 RepID=A0A8B8IBB6_VANTA